jgi:hypothetical protein
MGRAPRRRRAADVAGVGRFEDRHGDGDTGRPKWLARRRVGGQQATPDHGREAGRVAHECAVASPSTSGATSRGAGPNDRRRNRRSPRSERIFHGASDAQSLATRWIEA